jgi:exodeoxyribonuclease VII large subunit
MNRDLFGASARMLSVAELTRSIRGLLETRFSGVWVHGEISNYKLHPSGHQYFTLKDQRAQIACVIFRNTLPPFREPLIDGTHVQVYGAVSVFEARGQYQLSVEVLQPRGLGVLQAKFDALKRKLEAEGLFDPARKRALPKFPARIGIVTSPSGAAIRDMLNVLRRRAPGVQILINPVRVQGSGAAAEIATAIRELNEPNTNWPAVDLIVVTRGGGSIEDLWEFNEEIVARAIAASSVPVVSAVGHEVDFTIADFVADLRAPTPSAAAELIVPDVGDLARRVTELAVCLRRCFESFLTHAQTRLRFLSERALARELLNRMRDSQQQVDLARETLLRRTEGRLQIERVALLNAAKALRARSPQREISARRESLAQLHRRFATGPIRFVEHARQRFTQMAGVLRVMGPEATLRRGYSITSDTAGNIITSVAAVRPRTKIKTRVSDGEFASEVVREQSPKSKAAD